MKYVHSAAAAAAAAASQSNVVCLEIRMANRQYNRSMSFSENKRRHIDYIPHKMPTTESNVQIVNSTQTLNESNEKKKRKEEIILNDTNSFTIYANDSIAVIILHTESDYMYY